MAIPDYMKHLYCLVCEYPLCMIAGQCVNPACKQDKPASQIALIDKAIAERKKHEEYVNRYRVDYALSFRKAK